jgi:hypothetical protein
VQLAHIEQAIPWCGTRQQLPPHTLHGLLIATADSQPDTLTHSSVRTAPVSNKEALHSLHGWHS